MAPPLGEPGTGCHDNRRLGGSPEWGCGGVGSREGVQFGNCTVGRLLPRPRPVLSFLGKYPISLTPPPHSIAPLPCNPNLGARLEATPSHPLYAGSSMFLTPQQMDAFTAFTSGLPPGLPSHTCIPILPVLSAIDNPLSTSQHLAGPPTCSRSRPAPDPYTPPPLPLDPTLTHTDADQCIHDRSEGLHILTLSHGPSMPARPRVPDPGCGCEPRA